MVCGPRPSGRTLQVAESGHPLSSNYIPATGMTGSSFLTGPSLVNQKLALESTSSLPHHLTLSYLGLTLALSSLCSLVVPRARTSSKPAAQEGTHCVDLKLLLSLWTQRRQLDQASTPPSSSFEQLRPRMEPPPEFLHRS
jgi:hypothetical protein